MPDFWGPQGKGKWDVWESWDPWESPLPSACALECATPASTTSGEYTLNEASR